MHEGQHDRQCEKETSRSHNNDPVFQIHKNGSFRIRTQELRMEYACVSMEFQVAYRNGVARLAHKHRVSRIIDQAYE